MVTVGLLVFFNMELSLLRINNKTWVCYTGIYTFPTDVLYLGHGCRRETELSSQLRQWRAERRENKKKTQTTKNPQQKTQEINGMKQKQVPDLLLASELAGWGLWQGFVWFPYLPTLAYLPALLLGFFDLLLNFN